MRVTLRTDYVVYFRCELCMKMWSVAKHRIPQQYSR